MALGYAHRKISRLLGATVILCLLVGCITSSRQEEQSPKITKPLKVTVFVHGIISVKPFLSFSNFVKLMRDNITDSTYARTVEIIRKDPFFFQYHAMQEIGLHEIDMNIIKPGATSTAFARAFHGLQSPDDNQQHKYYTFGWSGLLSPRMRYLEAKLFYQSLSQLNETLCNQGFRPHYTVVGYSHGGNVAFKMGDIHENDNYKDPALSIDRLWLIGVPVLPDSASCLHSPLFKKIVHIFSVRDRIQPLDCFALNRFFSSRTFTEVNHIPLPNNLCQIQLAIRRPMRKEFSINPEIFDDMLIRASLRNADPGHTELWSFGWASSYRSNWPFYPLPASVFLPYIIASIENNNMVTDTVTAEIHPYCQKMILTDKTTQKIVEFIPQNQLAQLKREALEYKPTDFDGDIYKQKILHAMDQAKKEKRIERALTPKQKPKAGPYRKRCAKAA